MSRIRPKLRRAYLVLLPLVLTTALMVGIYQWLKPQLQSWVRTKIVSFQHSAFPYQIELETVDWSVLLPSVEIKNAKLIPVRDFDGLTVPHLNFKHLEAKLDVLRLLFGQIVLSIVTIDGLEAEYDLDPLLESPGEPKPLPIQAVFDTLRKIPLSQIGLTDLSLRLFSEKHHWSFEANPAQIYITNDKRSLGLELKLNEGRFALAAGQTTTFRADLVTTLTPETLDIESLRLMALNSVLTAKGILNPIREVTVSPQGVLDFDFTADLEKVTPALKELKIPVTLKGDFKSAGHLEFGRGGLKNSGLKAFGQKLQINNFRVGDVEVTGTVNDHLLAIPELKLTSEAGLIDMKNIELNFAPQGKNPALHVKAQLQSDFIDIHQMLMDIGVGDIPLEAFLKADIQCQGPLVPAFKVNCSGQARAEEFEVRTGPSYKDVVVQLEDFGAKGEFSVDSKEVSFKTQLELGHSRGSAEGTVGYATGFDVKYQTPDLRFSDIKNLAHMKIEGSAALEGRTFGQASGGEFEMTYSGTNVFFENFFLGAPRGQFRYEKSNLHFDDLSGSLGDSSYRAKILVDLKQAKIQATGESNNLNLPDLFSVFDRIFKMPVDMTGLAQAKVQLSGPLKLNQLSYELKSHVSNGSVAGESFNSLDIDLSSTDGEVKVQKALLKKASSQITAFGEAHPDGNISLLIHGEKLLLEEFENVTRLGLQAAGVFNFDMKLTGPVLSPETTFSGILTGFSIEDQEFPPSQVRLSFTKAGVSGTANIFEGKVSGDFILPYGKDSEFKLKATAREWNYAPLFALVGAGALTGEYEAVLSGDLELASEKGGLWASSGTGKVSQFLLKRGPLSLSNPQPMEVTFKNGIISLKNFALVGPETRFLLQGNNFSYDQLDVNLSGSGQMRLLQIFAPFLEELSGMATTSVHLGGALNRPEILGSAKIVGGFVKTKGFPHPFEKLSGEVQFSQHHISISQIRGQLAGGTISGEGTVDILGPKNLSTKIDATLNGVTFNVPDRIRTSGNAELSITGNWFPFTLAGTYRVFGGLVDKEFAEGGPSGQFRQSSYLPKVILQSAFEPLLFDLQILLEKPLPVKNSMVDGTVSGNLQLRGTPSSPVLLGKITTNKNTKVTFRDKTFEVSAGTVTFNDPKEINPELFVAARSRITEYDVNLLVQGTGKAPMIGLSSTPPLAYQDIISLLALGITSQQLEKKVNSNEQASSTVNELGTVILANNPVTKELQQSLGVNLQISSQYDDTRNIAVQKITLSRNLTEKVKASASRLRGEQSSTEVKLEYSFNPNVSAVGTWENRDAPEGVQSINNNNQEESILGLDLEFKKEFK